MMKINFGEDFH